MAETRADPLTIDELARRTGMTVRNIRAHQSRGLLPPPEVRSRTGYYGPEHVARIRLIRELQSEGFNLRAIQRVMDVANGSSEALLDFQRTLLTSFGDEEPEVATAEELQERLGGPFDAKTVRKSEKLGLVRPLGDGRWEIPSPTLMRAGEELVAQGIPLRHALAVADQIERHSRAIAESFVRLYMEDVVKSDEAGEERDTEHWERLRESLERLGPLATDAVRASFEQQMARAVERQLERIIQR